jgi:hypothetical protein
MNNANSNHFTISNDGSLKFNNTSTSDAPFTAGTTIMTLNSTNNNVGIGTTTPSASFKLDVVGNVQATSYNANSDYRLKLNIQPITKTIDDLKPVEYDMSGGVHSMGFIAHEVQQEFPFLVNGEKDGETMQSINYTGFIGLLVKEIQDLKIHC